MTNIRYGQNRILVLMCGALMVVPLQAQQNRFPNQNGGNSSFSNVNQPIAKPSSTSNSSSLTPIPDDFANLRLTAGVLLDVTVYDEPELATHARVDDQGNISLPLIGSLHVAGRTLAETQAAIENRYRSSEILKNPQVTLNVMQYVGSSVAVIGEVQLPGRLQMLAPRSLPDVIAMAGGETNLAGETVEVDRMQKDGLSVQTYHYDRGQDNNQLRNVMISPGDTVKVKRAGIVYVLGAVYRPGGYVMQEEGSLNVVQAVSLAQGTMLQAKIGGMRVIRHQPDGALQDISVPYKSIMEGKDPPLELQAQDIVYVPISKVKSVFTSGATIVGQTSAAAIYAFK